MPFHHSSSRTGRRSSRDRIDASRSSAQTPVEDGVLVLYGERAKSSRRPASGEMPGDVTLARLRAERDATREEVEYLKEQLQSMSAYHAHVLEEERRHMLEQLASLASGLAMLREELHSRTYARGTTTWSARAPLTRTSDDELLTTTTNGDGTGTR